jgi:hypothetical protein
VQLPNMEKSGVCIQGGDCHAKYAFAQQTYGSYAHNPLPVLVQGRMGSDKRIQGGNHPDECYTWPYIIMPAQGCMGSLSGGAGRYICKTQASAFRAWCDCRRRYTSTDE